MVVHDALENLEQIDPQSAELIKLHYFVGVSIPEVAEVMKMSNRSAYRHLAFARSWLGLEIKEALSA